MTKAPLSPPIPALAGVTGLLLLVPAVAMQFTAEVAWGPGDFIVAAVLIFGAGLVYALAARRAPRLGQRLLLGAGVATVLALVWAELAVGLFH